MYDAGNGLNIVLLDACRDNPFSRSFRTSSRGLARMNASIGTFIAYATAPGSVAADGTGRNGIFTKHLLKNLNKPGLKIEDVLKQVRIGVMQETGNEQVPWQASSLTGDFYFTKTDFEAPKVQYQEPNAPNLPQESKISFDDILQSAEKKKKEEEAWTRWQAARNSEYETVRKIDSDQYTTAGQKAEAWKRFFAAVSQDNPYSSVDDEMRTYSGSRISHWQSQKSEGKNADYASVDPALVGVKVVERDGRYEKYTSGVVFDTKNDLEWYVGADKDTLWSEGKRWVESLNVAGGGWRMPTRKELETLYNEGAGERNMTPLLKTTGWLVWSGGETKGSPLAWNFGYIHHRGGWALPGPATGRRGFAVRFRK